MNKVVRILITTYLLLIVGVVGAQDKKTVDSLQKLVAKKETPVLKAGGLLGFVDYYFERDKDSASYYLEEAIQYTKENQLEKKLSLALLKKAQLFIVKGKYDSSEFYYNRVWDQLETTYDYDLYTKYYGDYGVLHFYKGDFKGALTNFEKATDLAEKEKNEVDQLRFLNNKALAMSYLGEAEASILVHERAIKLAEKLQDSAALGKSFNNLGLIYEDMKEYEKALEYYQNALIIKENVSSNVDIINSLYNVSSMYKEIGEKNNDTLLYAKAEKGYYDVLKLSEEANYGKVKLFANTGLAQLATVRGKYQKAIDIYEEVIALAEKDNDQQTLRVNYLNVGVNYLLLNNLAKAETYLLKAKPLIEEAENPSDQAKLYKNLASLYTDKGEFKVANQYLLQQFELEKSMSSDALQDKISDFEVKYETEKKEAALATTRANLAERELEVRQKNMLIFGALGLALILGLLGYLFYNQQKLKNRQLIKEGELKTALAKIETQNRLQEQRLRISRDLHDNIGAQLTFIISSLDNLKFGFTDMSTKLSEKLTGISEFTNQTIYELRDTIWAMNKENITLEDLQIRISNFIEKAKIASDKTHFNFKIAEGVNTHKVLTSVEGMNVYRIIQEAVNNALKYSEATKITVFIAEENGVLTIKITDNGKGFDHATVEKGNGFNTIQKRAKDLKGKASILSTPGEGTVVSLSI
ncbi:tetratricopeptide repeat protein [Jejudonia soesokkakensis]|uniref:histidine kinase n=1 Tax=Jejudonia soesokkakensis TaxID=1323432 RepID=A0ABW2MTA8_9FLAO